MIGQFAWLSIFLITFIFQTPSLIRADYSENLQIFDHYGTAESAAHTQWNFWQAPPHLLEWSSPKRPRIELPVGSGSQADFSKASTDCDVNLRTAQNPGSHFLEVYRPTSFHVSEINAKHVQLRDNQLSNHQYGNFAFVNQAPVQLTHITSAFDHGNHGRLEQPPVESGPQVHLSKSPTNSDVNLQTAGDPASHFLEVNQPDSFHRSDIHANNGLYDQDSYHQSWNFHLENLASSEIPTNTLVSDARDQVTETLNNNRKSQTKEVNLHVENEDEIDEKNLDQSSVDFLENNRVLPRNVRLYALTKLYQQVGDEEGKSISSELVSFITEAHEHYFLPGPMQLKETQSFHTRLTYIINTSLLQIKIYAQILRKVNTKDINSLSKLQTGAFEFLKFFWMLALTGYANQRSKFYSLRQNIAYNRVLPSAKGAFEYLGRHGSKTQTASWLGTAAFFYSHWTVELTKSVKKAINNQVLSCAPKYDPQLYQRIQEKLRMPEKAQKKAIEKDESGLLEEKLLKAKRKAHQKSLRYYSDVLGAIALSDFKLEVNHLRKLISGEADLEKTFPNREAKTMITRFEYILNASFLKIMLYIALGKKDSPLVDDPTAFGKEFVDFLEKSFRSILFDSHQYSSELSKEAKRRKKLGTLEFVTKHLGTKGDNHELAQSASWVLVSHFIHSRGDQRLKKEDKEFINKKIFEMGKKSKIPCPHLLTNDDAIDDETGFEGD
ncbi:hypothetical protein O181_049367 [Austropuccinia psidii MF-1]|uniref:Uncharacterized protein n=1 Tax=Austropuccinia psidii MF-1 TaxID=1389203 RepID=A0A9Q3HMJ5_9BASI|nr:hypothetical protein [Austropuccinia psidii MF-1]